MNRLCPKALKSRNTVAPVVVNPLIDSNMALKSVIPPEKVKGNAPKNGTANHSSKTPISASRRVGSALL